MDTERFEEFGALINSVYRDIQRLKAGWTETLQLKQVHIFWLYLLSRHTDGLTATELAEKSRSTRALVSREIDSLLAEGYVETREHTGKRRYGWKFVLTDRGSAAAKKIGRIALGVQDAVSAGIPEEDLAVFYRTLRKLEQNFTELTKGKE